MMLVVLGLVILMQWWWTSHQQGEQLFQKQSEELMRSTLVALSHTAAYLIQNDQLESLKQLAIHIADTPFLQDVVVYDANGTTLSASHETEPSKVLYAPHYDPKLLALVQEIQYENRLIGYIKISMKLESSVLPVTQVWRNLMQQMSWMLLIAALVAFILRGLWSWLWKLMVAQRQRRQLDNSNRP